VNGRTAVPLSGEAVSLGRALDNAVIVDDVSVSRHHARLVRRGSYWLLEDLGSTHGCFVNGQRVGSSLLRAGDEVRLGVAVLRLIESADS
jgi:pSer/pThr/pTyr-binding forkhead associated (FHA) protein